jgi:hypothetical protein
VAVSFFITTKLIKNWFCNLPEPMLCAYAVMSQSMRTDVSPTELQKPRRRMLLADAARRHDNEENKKLSMENTAGF